MIQIQDDTVNQVVAPPSPGASGSAGQMYQQLIQKNQPVQSAAPSPVQSAQPAQSAQPTPDDRENSNAAEIDKLLAELDKLSKDLEEKPVAPVQEMPKQEDQSSEKFDFDSFLSDLEKKIDQESNKNKAVEVEDFRKNRPTMDLQDGAEVSVSAPVAPAMPEETMAKPVISDDESVAPKSDNEDLKAQNIFEMLGIMNISDSEKNQFLDELETMIWDDFIFHDLELLLTSEEYTGARQILDDQVKKEDEKKEALIIYLEKLIPDLDEVLYEKALELKSEMMGERLAKMKESADQAVLAKVKEAESLISQNRWKSAASLLNQ